MCQRPAELVGIFQTGDLINNETAESRRRSHAPAVGAGVVDGLRIAPEVVGMGAPQPVVLRTGDTYDKRQRILHGVIHRSGFGARNLGLHVDAAAAPVVHAGRRAVGGVIRTRADERVLAAPLVIKSVGSKDILFRRIVVSQRTEVAVHHSFAENDLIFGFFGVVIHGPDMPAPDHRAAGIVGADYGVALFDLLLVVAVGPHIERHLAVAEFRILDQPRLALPHHVHRCRKHRHNVAPVHGADQVVMLRLVDDITVGGLIA